MLASERSPEARFAEGQLAHHKDDYPGAERAFRDTVEANPTHADAWRLLGESCLFQGKHAEAVEAYERSLALGPDRADTHGNLAVALQKLARLEEADRHYRRALELRPESHESRHNLVALLLELKRVDAAEVEAERLVQLRPDYPDSHVTLGLVRGDQGRHEDACLCFERAVELRPDHVKGWMSLGQTRVKLARHAEAIPCFERVLQLRPTHYDACAQLGLAHYALDRCDEAIRCHERALRLRPDHPPALNNLGLAWMRHGDLDRSIECLYRAVELQPDYHHGLMNLNAALERAHRFDEGTVVLERALRHWPDGKGGTRDRLDEPAPRYEDASDELVGLATVQTSLAEHELRLGDFKRGWPRQRWRWCKRKIPRFPKPMWTGTDDVAGRTVLLHSEQGLGDTLQHVRFAALVKERGARVLVQCSARLHPLLRRCDFIDELFPPGPTPAEYDYHVPLLSLVDIFGVTPETIPQEPYLFADPALMRHWREELDRHPGLKVGICWQGNRDYAHDRERSAPLAAFEPIARIPGVQLVCLQMGPGVEQVVPLRCRWPLLDIGALDEKTGPFMDTAALMKQLDLFITVDTSAGHLAGALGADVWYALAAAADGRWMVDRSDSPWYPTARLLRQKRLNEWGPVFREMAHEIRRRFGLGASVAVGVSPGELLDRIAAIEAEGEHSDQAELERLRERAGGLLKDDEVARFATELREVNVKLRQTEDELRRCEQDGDFGAGFVERVRVRTQLRDRKATIRQEINRLRGYDGGR